MERRFAQLEFFVGPTFEDINADFGSFPSVPVYPVYFAGDIREPTDKIIFMGINPGYRAERNRNEQEFLQNRGKGYCGLVALRSCRGQGVRCSPAPTRDAGASSRTRNTPELAGAAAGQFLGHGRRDAVSPEFVC